MITLEQTQLNIKELVAKVNSGCYLSTHDRDNIVLLVLEQQQEINKLRGK